MTALTHTAYMTTTHLRQLWRQPWWIAVSLVQPVIWLLLVGIALLAGASFANGALGVAGLIGIAALISAAFASLSIAFALVTRKEETLIATLTFLQLPLSFVSSTLMRPELMPAWMESAANYNPVEWAVEAGRAAALGEGGFDVVASRAGLLAAFVALGVWLALRALEKYQRSL